MLLLAMFRFLPVYDILFNTQNIWQDVAYVKPILKRFVYKTRMIRLN